MVMSRWHACAAVIFVDFSEHFHQYLVIMLLSGIKLINALLINIWRLLYDVMAILWCACAHKPCGWHCLCFGYVIK